MTAKFRHIILSALLTFSMYSDGICQQKFYQSFVENYGRSEYLDIVKAVSSINSEDSLNDVIQNANIRRKIIKITSNTELKKKAIDITTLNILLAYEKLQNPNSLKNYNIEPVIIAFQSAEEYQRTIYLASYFKKDISQYKLYTIRGRCKYNLKDYYGAISDMSKAINLDYNTAEIYTIRAISYVYTGQLENAKNDYTYIIENLSTMVAESYVGRAMVKLDEGDKVSGCMDLSKAGEEGFSEAYEYIKEYCN